MKLRLIEMYLCPCCNAEIKLLFKDSYHTDRKLETYRHASYDATPDGCKLAAQHAENWLLMGILPDDTADRNQPNGGDYTTQAGRTK
jgi:hypothetical protein